MSHWLTAEEVAELGLLACGRNVQISRQAVLVHPEWMRLGSQVRIDAFAFLSAGPEELWIGDYVHLSVGTAISGASAAVRIGDFVGCSQRCSLFTASDDFTDGYLSGPLVPLVYRRPDIGEVILSPHALLGCGAVILPGVTVGWGAAVGALTVVRRPVPAGTIVAGNPQRIVGRRNVDRLQALELQFRGS